MWNIPVFRRPAPPRGVYSLLSCCLFFLLLLVRAQVPSSYGTHLARFFGTHKGSLWFPLPWAVLCCAVCLDLFSDLAKQSRKTSGGFSEVGTKELLLYFFRRCIFFFLFNFFFSRSVGERASPSLFTSGVIVGAIEVGDILGVPCLAA